MRYTTVKHHPGRRGLSRRPWLSARRTTMGGAGWGDYPTYIHATPVGRRREALTQGQIDEGWRDAGEDEGEGETDAQADMAAALTFLAVVFMVGVLCGVVLTLGLVGRV